MTRFQGTNGETSFYEPGERILAAGETVSNDTWLTHLNNNDLVVGTTGSGKTRNYVKPNLLQMNESVIVTDTKGSLVREVGPVLARHGYEVLHLDFTDPGATGTAGYNPLDFIRHNADGRPDEQDVMTLASALCPIESEKEPFWDQAAKLYVSALIAYVMEAAQPQDRTLASVATLLAMDAYTLGQVFKQRAKVDKGSIAVRRFNLYLTVAASDRTRASVNFTAAEKFDRLVSEGLVKMYRAPRRVDFRLLGQRKTALFLTVSDTDRSMDPLVTLLYTQALHTLCDYADDCCTGASLTIPVRLYLDDFATNCKIPDFDKLISVIRSRNIAVSVVLQSLTQLESLYGKPSADTIVNGCDHMVYLGGRDLQTAEYVSEMANRPKSTVLAMPLGSEYLIVTGAPARLVTKYRLEDHPRYAELGERPGRLLAGGTRGDGTLPRSA